MPDGGTAGIIAAAILVDLACRFLPAHLPYVFPFVFNAPVFLGVWFALYWYWRGLRLLPPSARPGRSRRTFFIAGTLTIYFVLQTRFEYLAQHMFFLNRVQAVTIGMAGPFGIAIGWPGAVLARGAPGWVLGRCRRLVASRTWRILCHPIPAMAVFLLTSDIWLIPSVHFAAMIDPTLYATMNLTCLAGGLLFWMVVLDPRPKPPARFSYLARAASGFLVMFPQIGLSSYIALTDQNLYSFYTLCGRIFPGVGPGYDQMLGGLIQWIPPGMMNVAALIIGLNALRLSEAEEDRVRVIPPGAKVYEATWIGRPR